MNTLNLIKKQINKASALHDAQISHTAYRGVELECKLCLSIRMPMAPIAIVDTSTASEVDMLALQTVGLMSLGCVAFIGMIYGELLLLQKV